VFLFKRFSLVCLLVLGAPPWCYVMGFFYLLGKTKNKERKNVGGKTCGALEHSQQLPNHFP
jgi:hypothetical protein